VGTIAVRLVFAVFRVDDVHGTRFAIPVAAGSV
jgi:hypothetical protein